MHYEGLVLLHTVGEVWRKENKLPFMPRKGPFCLVESRE